jgi:hypothetical protein
MSLQKVTGDPLVSSSNFDEGISLSDLCANPSREKFFTHPDIIRDL